MRRASPPQRAAQRVYLPLRADVTRKTILIEGLDRFLHSSVLGAACVPMMRTYCLRFSARLQGPILTRNYHSMLTLSLIVLFSRAKEVEIGWKCVLSAVEVINVDMECTQITANNLTVRTEVVKIMHREIKIKEKSFKFN